MGDYKKSGLGTALAVGASIAAAALPYNDSQAATVDTDEPYHEARAEAVETLDRVGQEAPYDSIVEYEIDTGNGEDEPRVTGTARFMYVERDSLPGDSIASYETATKCMGCTPDKVMGEGFSEALQEQRENGEVESMFKVRIRCSDFIVQKAIYDQISPQEQEYLRGYMEETIEDLEEDTGLDLAIDGDSIVLQD